LASGKGGVGKTFLTSELALALAAQAYRVLIIDGDLGLANIDIFFNIKTRGNLVQVIHEQKSIDEIVTPITPRIDLISVGHGLRELNYISDFQRRILATSLLESIENYHYVLIDTQSGLSEWSLALSALAAETILILTPDPASFADSYAIAKILNQDYKKERILVVANQVGSIEQGYQIYNRFVDVASKFLCLSVDYVGAIIFDQQIQNAIRNKKNMFRQANALAYHQTMITLTNQLLNQVKGSTVMSQFCTDLFGVA